MASVKQSFHFDINNTFCISLDSAPERWSHMCSRFREHNMNVVRWIASTPDNLTEKFADYMNPGQRACAQSHFYIWRHMVSENLPYALILEDDAMFDHQWFSKLSEMIVDVGEWDAIFLNASEAITPAYQWTLVTDQYLTGGYVLSLEGAKRLLGMFSGELWGADWMTTRLQTMGRSWSYFPWLIIQEGFESTIGSGVEADHAKVVRLLGDIGYSLEENYVVRLVGDLEEPTTNVSGIQHSMRVINFVEPLENEGILKKLTTLL